MTCTLGGHGQGRHPILRLCGRSTGGEEQRQEAAGALAAGAAVAAGAAGAEAAEPELLALPESEVVAEAALSEGDDVLATELAPEVWESVE